MIVPGRPEVSPRVPVGASAVLRFPGPAPPADRIHLGMGAPVRGRECHFVTVRLLRILGLAAVIASITDLTGTFVFQCHILEHEDLRLMGQRNAQ
jgi:hypothetical protein